MKSRIVALLLLSLGACRGFDDELERKLASFDGGPVDAGALDAGTRDAGEVDAGAVDAGEVDAGTSDAGDVDAGASDAGGGADDAGVPDAGPRCALGPVLTTQLTVTAGVAPAVGPILNGFLVGAVGSQVDLFKFDGTLGGRTSVGCGSVCRGVRFPRMLPTDQAWSTVVWGSQGATWWPLTAQGVPGVTTSFGLSCSGMGAPVNAEVLAPTSPMVSCDTGYALKQRDGGIEIGLSVEARIAQNEAAQAFILYTTMNETLVQRMVDQSRDNSFAVYLPVLADMALDVAPDGRWFAGGTQTVLGDKRLTVWTGLEDGGATELMLPAEFVTANPAAPVALAAERFGLAVAYERATGGVYVRARELDGGAWEPALLVDPTGASPAIAADRTDFLIAWRADDANSTLKLRVLHCQP